MILDNPSKTRLHQCPVWWLEKGWKNWAQRLVVSVPNSGLQQVLDVVDQELDPFGQH